MSTFKEEITLVNARDMGNAREGLVPVNECLAGVHGDQPLHTLK
jgi:hypothetical protein